MFTTEDKTANILQTEEIMQIKTLKRRLSIEARSTKTLEAIMLKTYAVKRGLNDATLRIDSLRYVVKAARCENIEYSFYRSGNVETVAEDGRLVARYRYDGLNRLTREDNIHFGTNIYKYDGAGNIVKRATYAFTLKEELGIAEEEKVYLYAKRGRNRLLFYGCEQCKYDESGNPALYRGRTLFWQGRRLLRYGKGKRFAVYRYGNDGMRTSKLVKTRLGDLEVKYYYLGGLLIAERRNDEKIYYLYGADGVAGFCYGNEVYLYGKNLQGDVTRVYKRLSNGAIELVAQYVYDAWGNHDVLDASGEIDDDMHSIGNLNPLRYRGYYYDAETGMYYLQSRYYDPETCRFISPDSVEYLSPAASSRLNPYAYCGNNPALYFAECGKMTAKPVFEAIAASI